MKIATSELEHLREEVKNCHRIIKDLQKKREFVGLTDEELEAAAKKLAQCFDYPWEHMIEKGRENMRVNAKAVIEAARGIKENT